MERETESSQRTGLCIDFTHGARCTDWFHVLPIVFINKRLGRTGIEQGNITIFPFRGKTGVDKNMGREVIVSDSNHPRDRIRSVLRKKRYFASSCSGVSWIHFKDPVRMITRGCIDRSGESLSRVSLDRRINLINRVSTNIAIAACEVGVEHFKAEGLICVQEYLTSRLGSFH